MHVEMTHISKAMVCPYLGKEIPDPEGKLGLDSGRVYMLLRDPQELEKGAPTFARLPVLIQHVPVNAHEPRRDLVVGTTGSDPVFASPYLDVSLAIWDAIGIAGVETKDQTELSSAYHYRADMTPGVYEGTRYDGIMRDIVGNHVALVDVGRAGPDVVVADRNPFNKDPKMKSTQRLIAAKADARKALSGLIAQDADLADLDKVLDALAGGELSELAEDETDDELYEDDPDNPGKRRKKAVAQDEPPKTEDTPKAPEVTKAAMDKAIAAASDATAKRVRAEMEALHTARKEVAPMVGEVALDSAEAVYKFALDQAKVDVADVHPSAYRALVKMHLADKPKASTQLGMDSASAKKVAEQFPNLSRFGRVI
ncbi:hypothetical protein SAMN03159371_05270 [Variovorax sp. NFACC28]|nr:hypothetical protein SAMN03159371_05270 [Variovorax sp. NFACC28]SEG89665.1 hypothetical protein SAMN03159365_05177 [Variovorax sp. NFACC29]SFD40239.1 hypothetical protein SAMN03159379_05160 [Variovorax sp. NFACC26]SFG42522.1 hypothetical protein SAMN03159447_03270 [Variovorax sp. NFACC27]